MTACLPVRHQVRSGLSTEDIIFFRERSLRINNSARFYGGALAYSVTSDGSRFLVNRMMCEPAAGPLQIVLGAAALR